MWPFKRRTPTPIARDRLGPDELTIRIRGRVLAYHFGEEQNVTLDIGSMSVHAPLSGRGAEILKQFPPGTEVTFVMEKK